MVLHGIAILPNVLTNHIFFFYSVFLFQSPLKYKTQCIHFNCIVSYYSLALSLICSEFITSASVPDKHYAEELNGQLSHRHNLSGPRMRPMNH